MTAVPCQIVSFGGFRYPRHWLIRRTRNEDERAAVEVAHECGEPSIGTCDGCPVCRGCGEALSLDGFIIRFLEHQS